LTLYGEHVVEIYKHRCRGFVWTGVPAVDSGQRTWPAMDGGAFSNLSHGNDDCPSQSEGLRPVASYLR